MIGIKGQINICYLTLFPLVAAAAAAAAEVKIFVEVKWRESPSV